MNTRIQSIQSIQSMPPKLKEKEADAVKPRKPKKKRVPIAEHLDDLRNEITGGSFRTVMRQDTQTAIDELVNASMQQIVRSILRNKEASGGKVVSSADVRKAVEELMPERLARKLTDDGEQAVLRSKTFQSK